MSTATKIERQTKCSGSDRGTSHTSIIHAKMFLRKQVCTTFSSVALCSGVPPYCQRTWEACIYPKAPHNNEGLCKGELNNALLPNVGNPSPSQHWLHKRSTVFARVFGLSSKTVFKQTVKHHICSDCFPGFSISPDNYTHSESHSTFVSIQDWFHWLSISHCCKPQRRRALGFCTAVVENVPTYRGKFTVAFAETM